LYDTVQGIFPRVLIVETTRMLEFPRDDSELSGHETASVYYRHGSLGGAVSFRPDVVLLDIGPAGNGCYEVAQKMRELPTRRIRLVAVTGYAV